MTQINDASFRLLQPGESVRFDKVRLFDSVQAAVEGVTIGLLAQEAFLCGGYEDTPSMRPYLNLSRLVGPANLVANWTRMPDTLEGLAAVAHSLARALLQLPEVERQRCLLDLRQNNPTLESVVRVQLQEFRLGLSFPELPSWPFVPPIVEVAVEHEGKWCRVARLFVPRTVSVGVFVQAAGLQVAENVQFECHQIMVAS